MESIYDFDTTLVVFQKVDTEVKKILDEKRERDIKAKQHGN